jgi:hypothetical protein
MAEIAPTCGRLASSLLCSRTFRFGPERAQANKEEDGARFEDSPRE